MLDSLSINLLKNPLAFAALQLDKGGFKANHVTLVGFVLGVLALPCLIWQRYDLALAFILLNRLFDGLDGALARIHGLTDAGGFLDISLDFLFYSLVPLGFVLAEPEQNAIAGALLIFSFVGTGSSFLAFAVMAAKQNIDDSIYSNKSLYYMAGLTGGTETIICFVLFCLLPNYFAIIAYLFALLCFITTFSRIYSGFNTLYQREQQQ